MRKNLFILLCFISLVSCRPLETHIYIQNQTSNDLNFRRGYSDSTAVTFEILSTNRKINDKYLFNSMRGNLEDFKGQRITSANYLQIVSENDTLYCNEEDIYNIIKENWHLRIQKAKKLFDLNLILTDSNFQK